MQVLIWTGFLGYITLVHTCCSFSRKLDKPQCYSLKSKFSECFKVIHYTRKVSLFNTIITAAFARTQAMSNIVFVPHKRHLWVIFTFRKYLPFYVIRVVCPGPFSKCVLHGLFCMYKTSNTRIIGILNTIVHTPGVSVQRL